MGEGLWMTSSHRFARPRWRPARDYFELEPMLTFDCDGLCGQRGGLEWDRALREHADVSELKRSAAVRGSPCLIAAR